MAVISQEVVRSYFDGVTPDGEPLGQGPALEELVCYVFGCIPGITVARRNVLNAFQTEEMDVAFWNSQDREGFYFLPYVILVECKNWSKPVGSQEVAYFISRVENRGLDFGILVATNGITGDGKDLGRAHFLIASALARGLRIVVITRHDVEALADSDDLVRHLQEKLCDLAVSGSSL